jgi:hypothetical protein
MEATTAKLSKMVPSFTYPQESGDASDDEDLCNPRNFYNRLYQNDDYLKHKSALENEII